MLAGRSKGTDVWHRHASQTHTKQRVQYLSSVKQRSALTVMLASLSEVTADTNLPPRLAVPMAATNDAANAPVTTDGMYTLHT